MAKLAVLFVLLAGFLPFPLDSKYAEKQTKWNRIRRQAPIGILNPPIPTSIAHFLGNNQPIDKCPRDEVLFSDGNCYSLLTQGPCTINQYILLDPDNNKPYCAERLCAPDRIFVFSDQLCHDPRNSQLCPPGRELYETMFGTPICQCPTGTYEGDDDLDDDVCDPLLGQTLTCPPGQVFWFRDFSLPPECLPDPCGGENLNRGPNDQAFVPFADGRCFQLGTMPNVCPAQTWYSIALERLQGVCTSLEDAGYQVYDPDTLARLMDIYGPPIARESTSPIAVPAGEPPPGVGGQNTVGGGAPLATGGVPGPSPTSTGFGPTSQGTASGGHVESGPGSVLGNQGSFGQGISGQGTGPVSQGNFGQGASMVNQGNFGQGSGIVSQGNFGQGINPGSHGTFGQGTGPVSQGGFGQRPVASGQGNFVQTSNINPTSGYVNQGSFGQPSSLGRPITFPGSSSNSGFSPRPANPFDGSMSYPGGQPLVINQGFPSSVSFDDNSMERFKMNGDYIPNYRTPGHSQISGIVGDVGDLAILEGHLLADIDVDIDIDSDGDVSLLQAPPGHELHDFFNSVRTLVNSGPHNRSRRSQLPHATPGNVFETRLVGCRAGAVRDVNAKCRDTVLPSRTPASRPARAAPPVPPRPGCPNGQAFNVRRMCEATGSAVNSINSLNLG